MEPMLSSWACPHSRPQVLLRFALCALRLFAPPARDPQDICPQTGALLNPTAWLGGPPAVETGESDAQIEEFGALNLLQPLEPIARVSWRRRQA